MLLAIDKSNIIIILFIRYNLCQKLSIYKRLWVEINKKVLCLSSPHIYQKHLPQDFYLQNILQLLQFFDLL